MDLDLALRMSAWFYIDSSGSEQGPFTSEEMVGWHQAGDLPANLLLRRDIDSHFSRLDTFPSLFGCSTSNAGLPPRLPSSISSPPALFGATYGIDLGDQAGIPWINGSGEDYGWQTRGMHPEEVPWMNGNALASPDYRWRVGEIPPVELASMNGSSGGAAADNEWQEIEMQTKEVLWKNGTGPAGAGQNWQMKLAVIKEENLLNSKHDPPQLCPETSQPELPKDINVDLLQKIKKAFKNTFRSGKDKEVSNDETESFEKAKIGIKEEKIESPENSRIEIKELSRNTKIKIKKEYIEQEIKSEILESDSVDFMGMTEKDGNTNLCVNNAEGILKQTESFPIDKQESQSPEAEALRNPKEIEKNADIPMKVIKKPSQYASNLMKVNGRRNRNVANQYGSGKRKKVEHRPWKYRPKDNKIGADKSISKNFINKKPLSRSKSKSVNSYESIMKKRPIHGSRSKSVNSYERDRRQKQGNKNQDWPFYEWKCPRLNCGGIIMRRSVICVACKRENPCEGVCQTEGCGQFNWLSMMVCPKCHQDVNPKLYSTNTKGPKCHPDVNPKLYSSNTKDKRKNNAMLK